MQSTYLNKTCSYFLISEPFFKDSYLISNLLKRFGQVQKESALKALVIRGETKPSFEDKIRFHQKYHGERYLTTKIKQELEGLYGQQSPAAEEMICLHGIADFPNHWSLPVEFLPEKINSPDVENWIKEKIKQEGSIGFFIRSLSILKPFWMKLAQGRIIGCHTAVLPYALGWDALEQSLQDGGVDCFIKSAGGSIFYINEGIDTGNIIAAKRLQNPFQYKNISEVKARCSFIVYQLLLDALGNVLENPNEELVGLAPNPSLIGETYTKSNYNLALAEQKFQEVRQALVTSAKKT